MPRPGLMVEALHRAGGLNGDSLAEFARPVNSTK